VKRTLVTALTCCTILLSSCLSTFYPFFTEEDIVFNSSLIGEWGYSVEGKKRSITFEPIPPKRLPELAPGIRKLADRGYLLTWKDSFNTAYSNDFVFLARIGKNFYLDLYPAETALAKKLPEAFKAHRLKTHACYRLDIKNANQIEMKRLDAGFLDELIRKKRIRIHYEETGSPDYSRYITASTKELQNYLIKYGDNPAAYNKSNSFTCHRNINF
jgi:hypothetical protein